MTLETHKPNFKPFFLQHYGIPILVKMFIIMHVQEYIYFDYFEILPNWALVPQKH